MRIFAFIPVLAVVACADSAAPEVSGSLANSAQILNQKTEVPSLPVTACNGEVVDLSGTVHTKANFTMTPSGKVLASFSSDYDLSGVGPTSGAVYNASQKVSERGSSSANVTSASNDVSVRLVGQGKVPNSILSMKTHVVIVDGELKVSHSDFSTRCQ